MEPKEARELTKIVAIAVLLGYFSAWIYLGSLPWWAHFIAGMELEYLGALVLIPKIRKLRELYLP